MPRQHAAAVAATRQCQGIVLFNNMVNLMLNISFTGGNTGSLSSLSDAIDTLCSDEANIPVAICSVRDMDDCEAEASANRERQTVS